MNERTGKAPPPSLALWVRDYVQNDVTFCLESAHNSNNFYNWATDLRDTLQMRGWRCHTQDIFKNSGEIPSVVIFFEIPRLPLRLLLGSWYGRSRPMVILWEAPVVRSLNWQLDRHRDFEILFTWDPGLIDGNRYRMISAAPRPFDSDFRVERELSCKKGFCTMIATNQYRRHPLELYSARLAAIRWFESYHPESFDLYGKGWNELGIRGHERLRRLGLMGLLARIFPPATRPSYRGPVARKLPVLRRYRFAICFENARDVSGYITEKIFDAFSASCLPIYWGAPDITAYVPEDCFIDFRQFGDYAKLYDFLKAITDDEYLAYLGRIEAFMRRQPGGRFSAQYTAQAIADAVTCG